jgi:hypothetical protein
MPTTDWRCGKSQRCDWPHVGHGVHGQIMLPLGDDGTVIITHSTVGRMRTLADASKPSKVRTSGQSDNQRSQR